MRAQIMEDNLSQAQNMLDSINTYRNSIETILSEVETIRDRTVESEQEFAIAKFENSYGNASTINSKAAVAWLATMVTLIGLTIVLANNFLVKSEALIEEESKLLDHPTSIIFILGPRLIIFSTLFIAIGFCIKMYRANKHNQILNKHRQNALNTFETFIKSSNDDKGTKDAILLEVTRTIFGNQNTGFNNNENEADSYSKIVEIVKGGASAS